MFFPEDATAPKDVAWFQILRQQSSTPLAMGELFVNRGEWLPLVANRWIDFIRCHISAIGGLTQARNVAATCEMFGVRTAWHGPGNVSPVGHAVNLHLDLTIPNFGIQEENKFSDALREVFPGTPEISGGYLYANDNPGLGIDIDEKAAARYPYKGPGDSWGNGRRLDGSIDVLNWFLGGHPNTAYGTGGRTVEKRGDISDHVDVTFMYPGGVQAVLTGAQLTAPLYRSVSEQFFCANGTIETAREYWTHYRSRNDTVTEKSPREITIDALENFIGNIKNGTPENVASVRRRVP